MQWRTIDGVMLDPLGQFNELETLIRGVLAPVYLLDYLRYFVLFEDDGTLVKKVAGYSGPLRQDNNASSLRG